MKKKQTTQPQPIHIVLLATLFLMGLITAFALASYNYNPLVVTNTRKQINGYDAMGYGRGSRNGSEMVNRDNCLMDGCLLIEDAEYPVAELDDRTIQYLGLALEDERKALTTYQAFMDKFGKEKPFINIARAEEHHISLVKALYDKYGLDIPREDIINVDIPNTFAEACNIGVKAEIANDALYQGMIENIEREDIKDVFTSLAEASRNKHLPSFEKCAN